MANVAPVAPVQGPHVVAINNGIVQPANLNMAAVYANQAAGNALAPYIGAPKLATLKHQFAIANKPGLDAF